jgi:RNA polymerase sigma-70 factor, ECF subfamily
MISEVLSTPRTNVEESPIRPSVGDITLLLRSWSEGEEQALEKLMPLVYEQLYVTAQRYMSRQKPDHLLQSTALVNEAYLHLVKLGQVDWQNRGHFFAVCARVMRSILTDYARSSSYQKRGGGAQHVPFDECYMAGRSPHHDLIALDDALHTLARLDNRKSQVVEFRVFGGMSIEEIAQTLHISIRTVKRDWKLARAWLLRELDRGGRDGA